MNGLLHAVGNKGFVLIYVLWISVIVTAMVMLISRRGNEMMRVEASIEARIILDQEMDSLKQILKTNIISGGMSSPYKNRIGNCRIDISNADYFLDLNKAGFNEIYRLCISLKIKDHQAEIIADSILDWIDTDLFTRPNGAENDYYQSLTNPYNSKNSYIESYDELLLIKGIDISVLDLLKEFISFNSTGINFKYAPYEVIYAITGDVDMTERIIEYRNEFGLDDESLRTLIGINLYEAMLTRHTFQSAAYNRLMITGNYHGFEKKIAEWVRADR
ncbi:general secretion pathway protein K [Desulfosarcina sp. BuS5]|uniref:general secretion pathway protein GspK n=1 Tax=Desulfosarcina sp. BuS5 TaxID=933262 RepID=UPI0004876AD3|nr:type II secretion system protein GspK [Desulfosarcina sp. BuS5]WDN90711.1 general secretion pathway protein K [Desulfosarcina sp. BuS5]